MDFLKLLELVKDITDESWHCLFNCLSYWKALQFLVLHAMKHLSYRKVLHYFLLMPCNQPDKEPKRIRLTYGTSLKA